MLHRLLVHVLAEKNQLSEEICDKLLEISMETRRSPANKVPTIESWLRKHTLAYTGATGHPFIHCIRDGTLDLTLFKRWMEQDYIFERALVPFAASVLVKAWKASDDGSDMEVILGGMASLNDELAWFKNEASKWGISLSGIVPHDAITRYCRFMESLMGLEVEYTVAITALWAIQTVYHDGFVHCSEEDSETPKELRETCKRWASDAFGDYCLSLQEIANLCLEKAPDDVVSKAEVVFLSVLEHEVEFWNMGYGKA